MKQFTLLFFSMLILASCNNNKKSEHSFNKYINTGESNGCWINTNTLKEGPAFSGIISAKLDSTVEWGLGFRDSFANIGNEIPKKITANAMAMKETDLDDAVLVVSIDRKDKNLFWQGADIKGFTPNAKEWSKVSVQYNLPKDLTPSDNITVFIWNKDKHQLYVDDFEVLFE